MEIKNNFFSIISLGNFNPAILTPDFLYEYCDFPIKSKIKSGDTTPVVSKLEFEKTIFLLELSKFQIIEKYVADYKDIKIVDYLSKYLEILKYTPIYIMGINFNSSILEIDSELINILNDKINFKKFLNVDELTYTKKENIQNKFTNDVSWDLLYKTIDNYINRVLFKLEDNKITINHNIELRDIDSKKEKIFKILNDYFKLEDSFSKIISYIIGGK